MTFPKDLTGGNEENLGLGLRSQCSFHSAVCCGARLGPQDLRQAHRGRAEQHPRSKVLKHTWKEEFSKYRKYGRAFQKNRI